jgi:peptide/nickel transport system substrate-binding protein
MSASLIVGLGTLVPSQVAGAQVSGSTVVVADTSSVQKLDPDIVTNFLDFQALGLIYDQLVQYNGSLQLVPDLATKWTYSDGNKLLVRAEPAGHLDPGRAYIGQPVDVVDQGDHSRDGG